MKQMDNPRMRLLQTDLERTMNLMGSTSEDLHDKVQETILMLGDCFPSGTRRDNLGITYRQMLYIINLAGFDEDEALQFFGIAKKSGGLDSNQADHLIRNLIRKGKS